MTNIINTKKNFG